MSAETELYAVLSGSAGLTALVNLRIYPDAIPENEPLPAVVFVRAGTNPTYTIGGVLVCEDARFQISAWGNTRASAEAVADQVATLLRSAGNPAVDRSSGFDGEVGLYAVTLECNWFRST